MGLGLDLDTSHGSLRTSTSTDLGASYNLTDEGVRLLSTSAREFHLNAAGHETRTRAERQQKGFGKRMGHGNAGGGGAKQGREDGRGAGGVLIPDSDRSPSFENEPGKNKTAQNKQQIVSSADILVFDTIGSGAGGSVRRAIHTKTHAFVALKLLTVFDKEKRKQLVNELRSLCDLANGKYFPFTAFRRLIAHRRLTLSFFTIRKRKHRALPRRVLRCPKKHGQPHLGVRGRGKPGGGVEAG